MALRCFPLSLLLAALTCTAATIEGRVVGVADGDTITELVDGADANLEQVKRGMAWHYKAYEREQPAIDRKAYTVAGNAAKAARRGLWADAEPVPPWEFRHNK